jgi:alpha-mannosidase
MRFSLEHQNPLVAGEINGDASAPYPAEAYSLMSLDDLGVILWALKPSEEGIQSGLIARLWRLGGGSRDVQLTVSVDLNEAKRTTHLETNLDSLTLESGVHAGGFRFGGAVKVSLAPSQIQTLRLIPSQGAPLS